MAEEKTQRKQEISAHLYDLPLVKMELDEVLQEHLQGAEKYKENTRSTDVRIAIGTVTVALTLLAHYFSKNLSAPWYKTGLCLAIGLFWAFSYAESMIMKFFFHQTFSGYNEKNEEIQVITKIETTAPIYTILIYFAKKKIPNKVTVDIRSIYKENYLILSKYRKIIEDGLQNSSR
ncbi:signal peptidase complex subunit 2 [Nematocida minor]|uniref:signal peptidase complex subunit 2 n=1 Tax=Nematocida minor TaxID=1912983 RepID=UPI002220954F|nr:signal peptidase complex subunit 2 [Nematocida minor]KAI5192246.1 signal peptidase complex subunit 2 [Nematocida minor]